MADKYWKCEKHNATGNHEMGCPKCYEESVKCKNCYDTGSYSVMEGGSIIMGDFIGDPSYILPLKIVENKCKKCKDVVWMCRFNPTDSFHEIGCPHQEWTKEQLQSALEDKKRFEQLNPNT